MIDIQFADQQESYRVEPDRLVAAARTVLEEEGISHASLSLAIVDDPTIHSLNRQFLQHDYPTDVLSFLLDGDSETISGEVVVSSDTAASAASGYGWTPQDELLLYIIHGVLHLVGYDDHSDADRDEMRSRERHFLRRFGLEPHYDEIGQSGLSSGGGQA